MWLRVMRDMNFRTIYYSLLLEFMKTVAARGNHWSKETAKIHFEWEITSVALKLSVFEITGNEYTIYLVQTYTIHLWVFFWVSTPRSGWMFQHSAKMAEHLTMLQKPKTRPTTEQQCDGSLKTLCTMRFLGMHSFQKYPLL